MPDAEKDIPNLGPVSLGRHVVLASASPYRQKLLRDAGVDFRVLVSDVDESLQPLSEPESYATGLAMRKAQAVAARCHNAIVIGADTICAIGNDVIGKPRDEEDAVAMISRACNAGLQRVITGVCIIDSVDMHSETGAVTSLVEMRPAPMPVIRAYVSTGEPMGKCGALAIESANTFVKRWEGSYSNIMGLPLEWLLPRLMAMAGRQVAGASARKPVAGGDIQ